MLFNLQCQFVSQAEKEATSTFDHLETMYAILKHRCSTVFSQDSCMQDDIKFFIITWKCKTDLSETFFEYSEMKDNVQHVGI